MVKGWQGGNPCSQWSFISVNVQNSKKTWGKARDKMSSIFPQPKPCKWWNHDHGNIMYIIYKPHYVKLVYLCCYSNTDFLWQFWWPNLKYLELSSHAIFYMVVDNSVSDLCVQCKFSVCIPSTVSFPGCHTRTWEWDQLWMHSLIPRLSYKNMGMRPIMSTQSHSQTVIQ